MSKASRSEKVVDGLVNLLLGAFSWTLPDIDVFTKVLLTVVLLGIWALSHLRPREFRGLTGVRYLLLTVLAIAVGVAESWMAQGLAALLFPHDLVALRSLEVFQMGFVYGLAVGLPVALLGVWAVKRKRRKAPFIVASLLGVLVHGAYVAIGFLFRGLSLMWWWVDSPIAAGLSDIPRAYAAGFYYGPVTLFFASAWRRFRSYRFGLVVVVVLFGLFLWVQITPFVGGGRPCVRRKK